MFRHSPSARLLLHIANLAVIVAILLPVVAVVIGGIQSEKALQADTRRVLPLEFTLDNFVVILTQGEQKGRIFEQATYLPDNIKKFYRAFANSLIVASSVTFLTLLFGSLSAYTIARLRFRWTLFLMQANIVSRFVPAIVLMIPLYIVIRSLGQLNSLSGVIIAETGFLLPYAILILAPYFDAIPSELEEAARIDGCTRLSAFVHIVLPALSQSILAGLIIVAALSIGEFQFSNLVAGFLNRTYPVVLLQAFYGATGFACAATVILLTLAVVAAIAGSLAAGGATRFRTAVA